MRRPPMTAEESVARRRYFEDGIQEFRILLEREFKRTHPSGYLNTMPRPNDADFRVGPIERKVTVDVTLQPVQIDSTLRSLSREIEQARPRGPGGATESTGSAARRHR